MWAVEKDPALRSDFCNLTLLDRVPDRRRLQEKMVLAFAVLPRLRQRVVSAPLRLVPPEWVDDPDLDLDYHVRSIALPAPGGTRELLDVAAAIADAPFDRSRPLWEFTIIDGLAAGGAALLQKVHHTITDGVGGLKLSLALVDFEADPPGSDEPAAAVVHFPADGARPSPLGVLRGAVVDAASRNVGGVTHVLARAAHVTTHPQELPGRAVDAARLASSMRRQVLVVDRAKSDVMTERSLRRRYELASLPLGEVKATAKRLGGTVNDAFVAGVTGALRRYHRRYGSACTELRLSMPVSTRTRDDTAANRFSPARVVVPLVPDDPRAHFAAVHDVLATTKDEVALSLVDALAGPIATMPTSLLVTLARNQVRTVDFAASNLRGSPVPLYLAGARIDANHPLGPRLGCALNVTVLSYCDALHAGLNIDPAAIVDVDGFMDDFHLAFEELFAA